MIKSITLLFLATLMVVACKNTESKEAIPSEEAVKTTTYYLIRHAEKDRSDQANKDPMLTDEGNARAERWSAYFDSISLDAVYSTKYLRTVMTATPTATKKSLDVLPYDPSNLYDEDFKSATVEKTVLVVGHSNTTPAFVNKIIGDSTFGDMKDTDNASLYVVTIIKDSSKVEIRTVEQ